jgi:hypothetical protein
MTTLRLRRAARAEDLGLTRGEFAILARLTTPQKIQTFLNAIPVNYEFGGETVLSVREVLQQRRAHCIEGAFVAAAALWVQGEPPLLVHLDCVLGDTPHVIAVFRRGRHWGAISKTNGYPLRFRDPVYRNLRELALSYFHEYYDKRGNKTLRSYARPFDMRRVDPALWITSERNCWEVHDRLADLKHTSLIPARQVRYLARRDSFERKVAKNVEYPRPKTRPRR